jgi:hypothetical protein
LQCDRPKKICRNDQANQHKGERRSNREAVKSCCYEGVASDQKGEECELADHLAEMPRGAAHRAASAGTDSSSDSCGANIPDILCRSGRQAITQSV